MGMGHGAWGQRGRGAEGQRGRGAEGQRGRGDWQFFPSIAHCPLPIAHFHALLLLLFTVVGIELVKGSHSL